LAPNEVIKQHVNIVRLLLALIMMTVRHAFHVHSVALSFSLLSYLESFAWADGFIRFSQIKKFLLP
jgi:hypothetical protein